MASVRKLRFGLVGAGWMADMACQAMPEAANAEIVAVHARDRSRTADFAERHAIPRHTGSYRDLLVDETLDAIYITSTNESHAPLALEAVEAGKAVLVEKPFALDWREAKTVADAAARRGVLVMEAMWSRFTPGAALLAETVRKGAIGDIVAVRMRQGFVMTPEKNARVFDPAKGGGVLLDIGVYPVSILEMLTGRLPDRVDNRVVRHASGVDIRDEMTLRCGDGFAADILVTCGEDLPADLAIEGTDGRIRCDSYVYPGEILVEAPGGGGERLAAPADRHRYVFQFEHFADCFFAGARESGVMPPASTLRVMRMLDMCREAGG